MSPHAIYWIGIVIASGLYLYLICRFIDGIWHTELTGIVYEVLWEILLRPLVRVLVGFWIISFSIGTLVMAAGMVIDPWKSLAWVVLAVPLIRILIWIYWMIHPDADGIKFVRNDEKKRAGIRGSDRFWMWCFYWGPYQGNDPDERIKKQKAIAAQDQA